jgi:hypothetical protein
MAGPTDTDRRIARQARLAGLVIAGTMVLWLLMQALGGHFGWAARWAYLFDFAALAAFVWALVVTYRIWRLRRGDS